MSHSYVTRSFFLLLPLLVSITIPSSSVTFVYGQSEAVWVTSDWSDCTNCDGNIPIQTRTATCELHGQSQPDSSCPSTKPAISQTCSCSVDSGNLSLTSTIVALVVGLGCGLGIFITCCYCKNQIKAKLREMGILDTPEEEMTHMEQEDRDIENEIHEIRSKRKKKDKKSRKPHTHPADAAASAARKQQLAQRAQLAHEGNASHGANDDGLTVSIEMDSLDVPEFEVRAALQSASAKRAAKKKSSASNKHTSSSAANSPAAPFSNGDASDPHGDTFDVDPPPQLTLPSRQQFSSSTTTATSSSSVKHGDTSSSDEVAKAIYSGQLGLTPLSANLASDNPLASIKKKEKEKKKSKKSSKPTSSAASATSSTSAPTPTAHTATVPAAAVGLPVVHTATHAASPTVQPTPSEPGLQSVDDSSIGEGAAWMSPEDAAADD